MLMMQHMRARRRPLLAALAVVFYLTTVGIVPSGYMAAAFASGSAFHLCPGDSRSALVIDALASAAKRLQQHQDGHADSGHTGHNSDHSKQNNNHSNDHHGDSETSADPGCFFAGFAGALTANFAGQGDELAAPAAVLRPRSTGSYRASAWLHPPVRSPPV
jgi:hypothetical protein